MKNIEIIPLFEDYIKNYDYLESDDLGMQRMDSNEIISNFSPDEKYMIEIQRLKDSYPDYTFNLEKFGEKFKDRYYCQIIKPDGQTWTLKGPVSLKSALIQYLLWTKDKDRNTVDSYVESLNESISNSSYEFINMKDDNDFKLEEYNIDPEFIRNEAKILGIENGISSTPNKDLYYIVIDKSTGYLAGCSWTEIDINFSFDVAVYKQYRNNGIATDLIKLSVEYYKQLKSEKGDDFEMEVYAVNPHMKEMLENKFGFQVVNKIGGIYLMTI